MECHDLAALGHAADAVTRRLHPESYRTYNIDRNINYTNICTAVCDFCAFFRKPKDAEGYVLDRDVLLGKIQETVDLGGDQILMQGGLHPEFKLEWYEELLRDIKRHFPQVNIHGFSPPEIHHFTKISKLPLKTVLERLKAAGLGSLPGGGAEILVDRVRKELTRGKVLTDDWLNVNRVWHHLGTSRRWPSGSSISSDCGSCKMRPAGSRHLFAGLFSPVMKWPTSRRLVRSNI